MDSNGSSTREVECRVCGDKASGKHYGVPSCDGCRGFFKRSIRRNLDYVCKETGNCIVDVTRRNQCQSCRFKKCLHVNMKRDAVQNERSPRTMGLNKSRVPFQTYNPTAVYFPHSMQFKNMTTSGGGGDGRFYPFIHAATSVMSIPTRRLLFSGQPTLLSPPPPPPTSSSESSTSKDKNGGSRGEEEVTTTTSNEMDFYPFISAHENVYESAAKLLFLSIKWARSVPSFGGLPTNDQSTLLEHSWSELFILSAAQWGLLIDGSFLIGKNSVHIANAKRLTDILNKIGNLNPDHTELACMKAVVLFKPETPNLTSQIRMELLQDQTMIMLQEYCFAKTPLNKIRFGKLLLSFPLLKTISGSDLEDLFFKQTVGEVSIQKLISDLIKSPF